MSYSNTNLYVTIFTNIAVLLCLYHPHRAQAFRRILTSTAVLPNKNER